MPDSSIYAQINANSFELARLSLPLVMIQFKQLVRPQQ